VLAPAQLPDRYAVWNRKWSAPFGGRRRKRTPRWLRPTLLGIRLCGPFAFQPNNDTRVFEYPWAHESLALSSGMRVLEIGGSLSGFQFVLDREGCRVVNVDPGEGAHGRGWPVTPESFSRINRGLGTQVELRNCFLDQAGLEDETFDRAVSISVLEHIPTAELPTLLGEVRRVLKRGGLFVITLDLFLDLYPFTEATANLFGGNISASWLVEQSGMELVHGDRSELYGYPEFDPARILARKEQYRVGNGWPTMIQTLVLRKP
jgi:SAM-dependent methyltransferase